MTHPHWHKAKYGPQGERCLRCGYIGEHTKDVCDGRLAALATLKKRAGLR